jgi:hypothetical protein
MEFDPKYTILDRAKKKLAFTCSRTDGSTNPATVVTVSGDVQITPEFTKADIWEHIGNLFDKKNANDAADAALIVAFETNTKEYLETRFN